MMNMGKFGCRDPSVDFTPIQGNSLVLTRTYTNTCAQLHRPTPIVAYVGVDANHTKFIRTWQR